MPQGPEFLPGTRAASKSGGEISLYTFQREKDSPASGEGNAGSNAPAVPGVSGYGGGRAVCLRRGYPPIIPVAGGTDIRTAA